MEECEYPSALCKWILWLLRVFNCTKVSSFQLNLAPVLFSGLWLPWAAKQVTWLQDPGWFYRLRGQYSALLSDPTARKYVQNMACGSPVKNHSAITHLFYYLVKWEYFIATDKTPEFPIRTQNFSGRVPAWRSLSSLPPAERVGGKEAGQGWALWSWKDSAAGLGVIRGCYLQLGVVLCRQCTWGVGRDGAAVVSYVHKELAIYHLPCCGVMKHKLLPSPLFSAPGRGNVILHIKAATHYSFQRKKLYVQTLEASRSVCSMAWQASQDLPFSWERQLSTDYHFWCAVWSNNRWFNYLSLQLFPLENHCYISNVN